jgi:hypothetical protein
MLVESKCGRSHQQVARRVKGRCQGDNTLFWTKRGQHTGNMWAQNSPLNAIMLSSEYGNENIRKKERGQG